MELYVNDITRTLAICSNDYVLILMDNSSKDNSIINNNESDPTINNNNSSCLIEFIPRNTIQLSSFKLIQREIFGFIGMISLKGIIYAGFICGKSKVGSIIPGTNVFKLLNTLFINFNGEVFTYNDTIEDNTSTITSGILSIMKLLQTGTFYYSNETDLANKLQDCKLKNPSNYSYTTINDIQDDYSGRFVWNINLIYELSNFRNRLSNNERMIFDKGKFFITLIRGFVNLQILNNEENCWITIISRQDSRKIGQLFGPACMDDEGNVANFVETEIIIYTGDNLISYSILKGNVPLFWKLDNHLLTTKIEFPRSEDASRHAFNRFFETLINEYKKIFILDSLSNKGSQPELSNRYFQAFSELKNENDELNLNIKYNKLFPENSLSSKLRGKSDYISILMQNEEIFNELKNYSSFVFDLNKMEITSKQLGIFLINTLDSNDRSNHIECKLSEMLLEILFGNNFTTNIWEKHNNLWDSNGKALGKLSDNYNTSIKTKNKTGGLIGKFAEQSKKYVSYNNELISNSNSGRQNQFDRLLGRKNKEIQVKLIDPIHNYVIQTVNKQNRDKFTSFKNLLIYTVTFNVNAILFNGDLNDLIFPEIDKFNKYDLIAIALEEVIELTPSKVLSIDLKIRKFWESKFNDTINAKNEKRRYQLLRGEQLGGILLLIYSNVEIIDNLQNIETSVKKTGFKGISANKGGVAITFTFNKNSRICFIAAHLAAGQSNSEERHQNFKTIFNGLTFKKCKNIKESDIIIWMGDLNFRIALPNEAVRTLLGYKIPSTNTNTNTNTQIDTQEKTQLQHKNRLSRINSHLHLHNSDSDSDNNNNNNSKFPLGNESMESMISVSVDNYNDDNNSIYEELENLTNNDDEINDNHETLREKSKKLFNEEMKIENENEKDLENKLLTRRNFNLLLNDIEIEPDSDDYNYKDSDFEYEGDSEIKELPVPEVNNNSPKSNNYGKITVKKLVVLPRSSEDSNFPMLRNDHSRNGSRTSIILKITDENSDEKNSDNEGGEDDQQSFYSINQEKLISSNTQLNELDERKIIEQLFEYDQLNLQMTNGKSFPFFDEMEITFKPTYKFDKGTDEYDSSEKQRVPSWTDRIITHTKDKRFTSLEQLRYNSIPKYKFSDHKPVYGIFNARLEIVNEIIKSKIERELYEITKQKVYSSNNDGYLKTPGLMNSILAESKVSSLIKQGLPAPSSKNSRWWMTREYDSKSKEEKIGKIKVNFPELDKGGYIINPEYPLNPFTETNVSPFIPKSM